MKRSLLYYLTHPSVGFPALMSKVSDRYAIEQQWKTIMDYPLDLDHPKTFGEKLQWLKLHDRNPLYTTLVDKYRVKQWIAEKVGEKYVIPTLAVYGSVDEIDLDKLPDKFVLKCNHDSGSVVICHDKSIFDLEAAKQKLDKSLKHNFYWNSREWPYKHVKRCVIVEQYLEETEGDANIGIVPTDYKFYCFDGEPRLFYVTSDKGKDLPTREDFFDLSGNHLEIQDKNYMNNPRERPAPPRHLDEMVKMCRVLAKGCCHLRVDFYEVKNKVYCGELTLYENSGFVEFVPKKYNAILGSWIHLPID